MRPSDFRYIAAYILPASAYVSLYVGGIWSFLTTAIAFMLVPAIELWLPQGKENIGDDKDEAYAHVRFFDWLLYLNVPIVWGLIVFLHYRIGSAELTWWEIAGMTSTVGLVMGANGINVAHELGHRVSWIERAMSKLLLLPSLYLQFHIDHNRGHHLHVGTPQDPATARRDETLYWFWCRVIVQVTQSAWRIERQRLAKLNKSPWSVGNAWLRYFAYELTYLAIVWWLTGWFGVLISLAIAIHSILILETIDYIEHYGLTRSEVSPGKYERVQPKHSWNSNHLLGRAFLYELTRHSDHHAVASRKYQILRHHEPSPELPFGYPASMLLATIPPLWFRMIHARLDAHGKSSAAAID